MYFIPPCYFLCVGLFALSVNKLSVNQVICSQEIFVNIIDRLELLTAMTFKSCFFAPEVLAHVYNWLSQELRSVFIFKSYFLFGDLTDIAQKKLHYFDILMHHSNAPQYHQQEATAAVRTR